MKFKKILAIVSALCTMCAVVPFSENYVPKTMISASAAGEEEMEYTYENFKYKKYADYVEISGVTDTETVTEADIPAEIDGLPVTSIGNFAFSYCSNLNSVTIPDSVTNIGKAFWNCSNLVFVTIPDSVTSIEDLAFYNTSWLKAKQAENPLVIVNHILIDGTTCSGDVIIPDSVTSIGSYAFYDCSSLTSVTIADSVTSIENNAFEGCSGLTSVTIADSVTYIGHEAFLFCSGLTSVKIPNSVTYIGFSAFHWCSGLISAIISDSVTSIESGTFENCSVLTSVHISDNATYIGDSAFEGCSGLTFINIPDGITTIESNAFNGCSSLPSVTIPDGVTTIKNNTFNSCSALTSVTIPDNVSRIEMFAFGNCSSLTSVTIENPDCEIDDSNSTIFNGNDEEDNVYFNGTIYGYENSTAQAYAEKWGYKFESLGSAPETTEIAPGDANNSGKVDILDVITVNKAILGKEKLTDEQLKAIDFNSDGKPDASDSLKLMKFIVGLITSLTE